MSVARLLSVLVLALAAASGLSGSPDETPETEVSAADVAGLHQEALAKLQAKEYQEAAGIYAELLKSSPGDPVALYNLACCFSLLDRTDKAVEFLEAAWTAGFRDLELIRSDPDLENLREHRAYQALVKKLEHETAQRERLAGILMEVPAPVLATARVVLPDDVSPGQRYPLVVGLHGAGGSATGFAGVFLASGVSQSFVVCAPNGPYATVGANRLGHLWYPPRATNAVSRAEWDISESYVLEMVKAAQQKYPVDPEQIYLVGFSQGGRLAYTLGLKHPEIFKGIVAIATWFEHEDITPAELRQAAGRLRILVSHSPDDEGVNWENGEATRKLLTDHGVAHEFIAYDGGHVLPATLLRKVAKWLTKSEP